MTTSSCRIGTNKGVLLKNPLLWLKVAKINGNNAKAVGF